MATTEGEDNKMATTEKKDDIMDTNEGEESKMITNEGEEDKMATSEDDELSVSLRIGQVFCTYDEFEKFIEQRRKVFSEKWYMDSGGRTVKYANARISNPDLHFKEAFKYAFVNLKCIHGGQFKSRGTKRNRQSLQLNCPAKITLVARRKEDCMVITKLNLHHNHELIPESCGYYHTDRKPTEEQREEIIKLLKLGLPTGNILKHMRDTTGKVFRRHDIHNVSKKIMRPPGMVEVEEWTILSKMYQEDFTAQLLVRRGAEDNVAILFFQTDAMRRILKEYRDVLFVINCLDNLGYPMYVFMCVDGENVGHVVCYGIVRDVTKTTLSNVFTGFISHNDVEVKTVVVDKDPAEIAAIKEAVPGANILLYRYHVLQAFKAAATNHCFKPQREKSLDLLTTMLDCSSEEDFIAAYGELPKGLKNHVEENWISNKESWAQHMTKYVGSWGSKPNKHMECHKRLLKSLSLHTKSLPSFIQKILTYHCNEEQRLALSATDAILTTRAYHHSSIPSEHLQHCSSFLSHAACNLVKEQMEKLFLSKDYRVKGEIVYVEKEAKEKEVSVRGGECSCLFFLHYHLPCWHLMAYNLTNSKPLVNEESVPKRWLKTTLLSTFTEHGAEGSSAAVLTSVSQPKKRKVSNDVQKREEASKLWDDLMNVMVDCGQESFEVRCNFLRSLMESWSDGKDIPDVIRLEKGGGGGKKAQTTVRKK